MGDPVLGLRLMSRAFLEPDSQGNGSEVGHALGYDGQSIAKYILVNEFHDISQGCCAEVFEGSSPPGGGLSPQYSTGVRDGIESVGASIEERFLSGCR